MSNKKKLVYIVTAAQSMESFVAPRMAWLREDFDVVGICSPGTGTGAAREAGMRLIEIPIERHISLWRDVVSLWRLWRALAAEKPDIVHSMTPKAGLLGMAAAFLARVPVRIHTFTGLIFPWRSGALRFVLKTTDRLTCLFATIVNPEGEGVRRQLEEGKITRKPMRIIAHGNINGVDLARFRPDARRAQTRAGLGFMPEHTVFAFVGRLVADKGVTELTDAFMRLRARQPLARLLLIGREEPELDPLPARTRQCMRDCPDICAPGERQDVERWLAAADVFVLPSRREGFCNSLLEAAATALPCITYDICGCNDSVDAETGILVPPYDADALEKAMEELARDPRKCRRLGEAGRRRMQERFSRAAVWAALRRFYAEVSAGSQQEAIPRHKAQAQGRRSVRWLRTPPPRSSRRNTYE